MVTKVNMFSSSMLDESILSDSSDGNIFITNFEDSDLEAFTRQFLRAENSGSVQNIIIWVSSYGGNVHNALAMIDLLETATKPVFLVAYGKAMSAGCLLVASGARGTRFVTPNSYMMIHEASGGAGGKTKDVIQQAAELSELNEKLMNLISKYANKKPSDLKVLLQSNHNTDLVFSAEQAVKFGLADRVGIPKVFSPPQPETVVVLQPKKESAKNKRLKKSKRT